MPTDTQRLDLLQEVLAATGVPNACTRKFIMRGEGWDILMRATPGATGSLRAAIDAAIAEYGS